jgi:putative hemolysin
MNELWILVAALLASAFFSGTEIAFTSLSSARVLIWQRSRRLGSDLTKRYFDEPDALLITLLVGTNVANISFTSLATLLATNMGLPEWLYVPAITLLILFFGETLPKLLFHEWTNRLFPALALPARVSHLMLWPVVAPVALIFKLTSGGGRSETGLFHLRAHIGDLAQDLELAGQLSQQESRMIDRALHLRERSVGELMTPRTDVAALADTASTEDFANLVMEEGYSCMPVYHEDLDQVLGYVNARDLFQRPESLEPILRPIPHVPASMPARALLERFGREKMNIVVVVDEYGGTAGIVTLEDLLEDLVGRIDDEHDDVDRDWLPLKDGRFLVAGRLRLEVAEEELGITLPSESAETLGGWICESLGRIPAVGEVIELKSLRLTVRSASPRELKRLLLERIQPGKEKEQKRQDA